MRRFRNLQRIGESGGFCEVRGFNADACLGADLIEAGLNEGAGEFGPLWGMFTPERLSAVAATCAGVEEIELGRDRVLPEW